MRVDPLPNLNAEVARALWGPECVNVEDNGVVWVQSAALRFRGVVAFDTSLNDCHRHMLPALEKRGLGGKFYDRLAATAAFRVPYAAWDTIGFGVLRLPPSDWCQAFLEVWTKEASGDLGPQPWPCPTGHPHLVFTRTDGTVIPHVGMSGYGCPANDKPYQTPLLRERGAS